METNVDLLEGRANRIVKDSTVSFKRNQVILRIPVKKWWKPWVEITVQNKIKQRINNPEFKEWLKTHYASYRFGDLIAHRDYYELIGEAYFIRLK